MTQFYHGIRILRITKVSQLIVYIYSLSYLFTFFLKSAVYLLFLSGLVNWAFLLLCLGGIRLSLENFNKYGIRVNPKSWIDALFGQLDPFNENREYPTTFLILCKNKFCLFLASKFKYIKFLIF